ncbi:uncharacterized protein LOC119775484 [Cyprinodon tularosa]|uniref:uncharacterized protein LOC119775484 n=1 Tax=Cyprinodon tularosa TaxID=77115 RepID=UPI0018E200D7|nr:uncharacterized protein LOC119775484 [Cyprinodon tularosa]XP_038129409.1 uncharacterized protein LOC119775484 [Cyprinodon tularosa]
MEEEIQELKELVASLRADNERLRQGQASLSAQPSTSSALPNAPPTPSLPVAERLIFVPRDRKCPIFRGRTGIGLSEWTEEARLCMRARHLSVADQAFFLFDHLEGEARNEIKYRSSAEREDPARIFEILQELYGCSESYVALQEAFFSRRQQEGESLQEFSLALMGLMERVKQRAPAGMLNSETLLRDQFVEQVLDSSLRRELKQLVRTRPDSTLREVRAAAIQWEREGVPHGGRNRSQSLPSVYGVQYGVHGGPPVASLTSATEMSQIREMLKCQQKQLQQLSESISQLQNFHRPNHPRTTGPVICRRCNQPGHFARECDGVRVPRRTQCPPNSAAQSRSASVAEN